MFERYTEAARRMLFFARYECSQLGGVSIETEQLMRSPTHSRDPKRRHRSSTRHT